MAISKGWICCRLPATPSTRTTRGSFIPYNLSPLVGIGTPVLAGIVDGLFFLVKVFAVMFISMSVIRAAMARFKISQVGWVYIIAMTLISLVGLILIAVDSMV